MDEEHARVLTPLATEFRYPGDMLSPSPERAGEVLKQATEVFDYASKLVDAYLAGA
jgi:hypothetical protein